MVAITFVIGHIKYKQAGAELCQAQYQINVYYGEKCFSSLLGSDQINFHKYIYVVCAAYAVGCAAYVCRVRIIRLTQSS